MKAFEFIERFYRGKDFEAQTILVGRNSMCNGPCQDENCCQDDNCCQEGDCGDC